MWQLNMVALYPILSIFTIYEYLFKHAKCNRVIALCFNRVHIFAGDHPRKNRRWQTDTLLQPQGVLKQVLLSIEFSMYWFFSNQTSIRSD